MHIDFYNFGQITIDGQQYKSDLIIYPDRIKNWWRKEGHQVYLKDLQEVLKEKPEILIIGTGASGLVEIPAETREYLAAQKIELIAQPTEQACQTYNRVSPKKKVIAALHLTC